MFIYCLGGASNKSLTATVENADLGCDPLNGRVKFSWSINGGDSGVLIDIDYNYDGGSSWTSLESGLAASLATLTRFVNSEPGFTSLDDMYFRIRATVGSVDIVDSPSVSSPPYPCA